MPDKWCPDLGFERRAVQSKLSRKLDTLLSSNLRNPSFEESQGKLLNFATCEMTADQNRGLRGSNNVLIHKKVMTHLKTAFGLDSSNFDELPEDLTQATLETFFGHHHDLKANFLGCSNNLLPEMLIDHPPNEVVEKEELLVLLVLHFWRGDELEHVAIVHHKCTGVLSSWTEWKLL